LHLQSIGGWGTVLQAGRLWVRDPIRSIYLILPAALGPGVHSASNRNECQKQKNVSGSGVQPVCRADNLTAICELIV
jgi:hypothetical protein